MAFSQAPKPAYCQMGAISVMAGACGMPCCRHIPMPNCPRLNAQAPRDLISTAEISLFPVLHVIAMVEASGAGPLAPQHAFLAPLLEGAISRLFSRTPLSRAPPLDVILLSA
jgi:hypothetical protein